METDRDRKLCIFRTLFPPRAERRRQQAALDELEAAAAPAAREAARGAAQRAAHRRRGLAQRLAHEPVLDRQQHVPAVALEALLERVPEAEPRAGHVARVRGAHPRGPLRRLRVRRPLRERAAVQPQRRAPRRREHAVDARDAARSQVRGGVDRRGQRHGGPRELRLDEARHAYGGAARDRAEQAQPPHRKRRVRAKAPSALQ